MRTSFGLGGLGAVALALSVWSALPAGAESEADKGRALAERFATGKGQDALPAGARRVVPAPQPEAAEEQRLSEEIDMLARARAEAEARREELSKAREAADRAEQDASRERSLKAEAEQRRTAEDRQRAEEALRAAEMKRNAEEARQAAEAQRKVEDEQRLAAERRKAEEARQAAEAQRKIEDEQRLAAERRKAEEARQAAEAQRKVEDEQRLAAERRKAEELRHAAEAQRRADEQRQVAEERLKAEEAQQAAMEAEREAEAERIAEALRKAREARMTRDLANGRALPSSSRDVVEERTEVRSRDDGSDRAWRQPDRAADGRQAERMPDVSRRATRVAVLMMLEPGNYGIRRNNKTADPLLCGEEGCYVSAGSREAADLLGKRRALGIRRTLGGRAGACSNSLGCIFRDIDLVSYPAVVQPVDMHVIKHDRRQPLVLHETSDCRLAGDQLSCTAFRGAGYTMWVVPEELVERAGPAALERALDAGLPDADHRSFHAGRG